MSGGGMGGNGGGYGGGMGGYGGGYQPRGYGQQSFGGGMPSYGGQSQGYGGGFGGQSFGGGNPWMRQQNAGQPSYGNKMGFQPQPWMSQPQTGGDFQMQERQPYQVPRNDMRIPPGQQSFTPPPLGANDGMQVAPPMNTNSGITPEMIPPGAMQKPMAYGGDSLKAGGNIYGPNGGMSPPGAYDAMVQQGQQEYDARMKMPAKFGRYADGSPREDPNALNARGQAHQAWYGGGWGR